MSVLNVLESTRSVTWPVKVMIIACISPYIYKEKVLHVFLYIKSTCNVFFLFFLLKFVTVIGCEIFLYIYMPKPQFSN